MNELEKLAGFNNNKDGAQLEISDSEEEEVNRNKTEKPSEDGDVPKSPGAESSYSNFMQQWRNKLEKEAAETPMKGAGNYDNNDAVSNNSATKSNYSHASKNSD